MAYMEGLGMDMYGILNIETTTLSRSLLIRVDRGWEVRLQNSYRPSGLSKGSTSKQQTLGTLRASLS